MTHIQGHVAITLSAYMLASGLQDQIVVGQEGDRSLWDRRVTDRRGAGG